MQGRENYLICRECGKKKLGNFFISETLCKKCAAKRRVPKSNDPVTIGQNIIVTERVQERLKKSAESQIPFTILDWLARILAIGIYVLAIAFGDIYGFLLGWLPAIIIFFVLSRPRGKNIEERIVQLAEIRKKQIEEGEQFYGSAEWRSLRNQVLKESIHVCCICGRKIKKAKDVTVDHIKPRSKYPDLAVKRENLMVLCRSCNSAKGAKEYEV